MPVRPDILSLTNVSADVLNAIRNSASQDYRNYVPIATPDADSIKGIGSVIMDSPNLQNEFVSALINRIGRVIINSKMYSNPWSRFKRGYLEFGETVEEIFVEIARPFQYDPAVAESEIFKREKPDYRSAFHVMNYQKFYKVTISQAQLKTAFLSYAGMSDLISKTIESLYTAANYDEFLVMKYLLARHLLDGHFTPVKIADWTTAANLKSVVSTIKSTSNQLEFLNTDYNVAGVHQHTPKREQYLIMNASFDAAMDVEVLASAFNMNKAEFLGNRVLIDGFDKLDLDRLNELFDDDPAYVELEDTDLAILADIPCVLVDRDYFMVFDNLNEFREQPNGEGLYWNYWYHQWKTFSVSPFSNAVVFTDTSASITSVTVTPDEVTLPIGASVQLSAAVVGAGFVDTSVTWSSATPAKVAVSKTGVVTVLAGDDEDEVVITATSNADSTKTDTCTVTVSVPE